MSRRNPLSDITGDRGDYNAVGWFKILGNLGDSNGEYGGFLVYEHWQDGSIMCTAWDELSEDEDEYQVYTWQVEDDVLADLDWVDWDAVASGIGFTVDEIKEQAHSANPVHRAGVYQMVASYYGYSELDSSPDLHSSHEMALRWPTVF